MVKLAWDKDSERLFETGTSNGVVFVQDKTGKYGEGVAWNGLTSVKQSPEGAEPTPFYADNREYLNLTSAEKLKGTIEAYTYPDKFMECDGSKEVVPGMHIGQQTRTPFGLVYSTIVGNDTEGIDYGEKIHILYGCKASPSERSYETVNADPNAITFSWAFSTTPSTFTLAGEDKERKSSYICINSEVVGAEVMKKVKDLLYGTAENESSLPSIEELITLVGTPSV